ncbi:MAG: cytochrome b/b6 domain-containing protein [bacterium]
MHTPVATGERIDGTSIIRFDVHQRAQHTLMFASFFILAITGLPLRYSDWGISGWWIGVWHGIDNVRAVHRYAGWVMIAVCVYHLVYLFALLVGSGRRFPSTMLPKVKDISDFIQDMKHAFGLSKEPPKFDRFSYRNKFAYWLVYCGAFVMVGSGVILMYPVGTAAHLTVWTYPLALIVHSDAAILAIGWMVIVHLYFAHFARPVFPVDKSILTGKVPFERYEEEFPLEYARIMAAAGVRIKTAKEMKPAASAERPELSEPLAEEQSDEDEST